MARRMVRLGVTIVALALIAGGCAGRMQLRPLPALAAPPGEPAAEVAPSASAPAAYVPAAYVPAAYVPATWPVERFAVPAPLAVEPAAVRLSRAGDGSASHFFIPDPGVAGPNPVASEIALSLREVPLSRLPGRADSNSPAFWDGGELVLFNSAEWPERSNGASLGTLNTPSSVTCLGCERPGGRWLEAVWQDPDSRVLYGWYHFEPSDLPCQTAPIIGSAISRDGGRTWVDQGPVLESGYAIDCEYDNGFFVGGHGDFHVIPDRVQGYFYFLFSNYAGPIEQQGVAIARSAFAERGQPGTVFKYHRGTWSQPGLGGDVTPLFASGTGWKGPYVEAFWGPSVHWNEYLNAYVALLNHTEGAEWRQEGVYLTVSADLLHWSEPQKILDSEVWYPQVLGAGARGTDTLAGKTARVYVGGFSTLEIEFHLAPSQVVVAASASSDD